MLRCKVLFNRTTLVVGLRAASQVAERSTEVGWHTIRMLLQQSRQEVRVEWWVEVRLLRKSHVQDVN